MKMNRTTSFENAADLWLSVKRLEVKENTFSESYERTVNKILLPRLKGVCLGDIDRAFTVELFSELAEYYSDTTLHKCKIVLGGIINEARYCGAELMPFPKIKIRSKLEQTKKKTYSIDEVKILTDYCRFHNYGLSIILLLELGLRCSEMLALRWNDINFAEKYVEIKRACVSVRGKAVVDEPKSESSIRDLPLSPEFCEYLESLRPSRTDGNGYIVNVGDTLMTPSNYTKHRYDRVFKDIQREIDLRRLSPHELRHTCGTLLYQRTGDIYAVSKYLGHSSVAITAKYYVHSDVEMLRERLFG